jgi:hypothetical protein
MCYRVLKAYCCCRRYTLGPCGTENLREGAEPAPEVAVSSSPLQTMVRRRVLLFLKPFDVYPPRPCAGASLPTVPPPPPPPRAANPKVRTSLAHPLRFENPWFRWWCSRLSKGRKGSRGTPESPCMMACWVKMVAGWSSPRRARITDSRKMHTSRFQ